MNNEIPAIAKLKTDWLVSHVDVVFPAKETLLGKQLYLDSLAHKTLQPFTPNTSSTSSLEIFLVDFHKMTVMFALNQSSMFKNDDDKANVLEFFTQIILSDEHNLYLALSGGEVVGSAVSTFASGDLLVSDLVYKDGEVAELASRVIEVWEQDHTSTPNYWLEL